MTAEREGADVEEFIYDWAPTAPRRRREFARALAPLIAERERLAAERAWDEGRGPWSFHLTASGLTDHDRNPYRKVTP